MTRSEMIAKAIEMAESDMSNIGITSEEIIDEVNRLSDNELKDYVEGI